MRKVFKIDPDVVVRAGQIVRINGDLYRVSHSAAAGGSEERYLLYVDAVLDLHLEKIEEKYR